MDPRVKEAAEWGIKVYNFSLSGGNLHIVLDDDNIDDYWVKWCYEELRKGGMEDTSPEQLMTEMSCCELLLKMPIELRQQVLDLMQEKMRPSIQFKRPLRGPEKLTGAFKYPSSVGYIGYGDFLTN